MKVCLFFWEQEAVVFCRNGYWADEVKTTAREFSEDIRARFLKSSEPCNCESALLLEFGWLSEESSRLESTNPTRFGVSLPVESTVLSVLLHKEWSEDNKCVSFMGSWDKSIKQGKFCIELKF